MKAISFDNPLKVVNYKSHYEINYNVHIKTDQETQRQFYEFDSVKVTDLNYDTIVSFILRAKYSQDKEFAFTNNYACEGTSPEWEAYQDDRINAKAIAREILNIQ